MSRNSAVATSDADHESAVSKVELALAARKVEPLGVHVPALDGIRGVAILLVMMLHFASAELIPDQLTSKVGLGGRLYLKLANQGGCGVDLFFVLSGFLITRILLRAKGRKHYFRNFYMRRFFRIFPLYYGTLFVLFVVAPWFAPPPSAAMQHLRDNQHWLWLYIGNVASAVSGMKWKADWLAIDHFWSLAVEEHFYLLWPLIVYLLSPRALMRLCVPLIALSVACKLWFLQRGMADAAYTLTICRTDALSLGGALAAAAHGRENVAHLVPGARIVGVVSAAVTAILALGSGTFWWTTALTHSVYPIFFAALITLAVAAPAASLVGRFWRSSFLRFFGTYSYGLYVVHYLLRPTSRRWLPIEELTAKLGSVWLAVAVFATVASALSIVGALLSWHLFEKHFLSFKKHFEDKPH